MIKHLIITIPLSVGSTLIIYANTEQPEVADVSAPKVIQLKFDGRKLVIRRSAFVHPLVSQSYS